MQQSQKTKKNGVKKPEGQGLNDLYVRFFRMAERRIAEMTGHGIVCFISNYSWLDGLSFTVMREHLLESFDAIRIDNLNGDKYKTGKTTPDGMPDPSIFSTPGDPVGIQVGTAIATLVRKAEHTPADSVGFRHLWGQTKLTELSESAEAEPAALYDDRRAVYCRWACPLRRWRLSRGWSEWPSLPDLFPTSFPGVKTSRDSFLVDVDLEQLRQRVTEYFNPGLSHEEIATLHHSVMDSTGSISMLWRYAPRCSSVGGPDKGWFRSPFAYRPYDTRWLYWEAEWRAA